MSAYSDAGTSFLINYNWIGQALGRPELEGRWFEWGAVLMKHRAAKGASRFVLLAEASGDRLLLPRRRSALRRVQVSVAVAGGHPASSRPSSA
jgi:hypothetical protein